MKVLLILGHPANDSFCGALARAYVDGAGAAGAEVEMLALSDLKFDPILHHGYRGSQEMEPDVQLAQEMIKRADHLVVVTPTWWASMPALLKGFFDRVFLPGFAFKYRENSSLWDRLLAGRSARLIVTMDAPAWYNFLVYRNSVQNTIKYGILRFCGFKPVRVTTIGGVKGVNEQNLNAAIENVRRLGEKLI